MGYRNYSSVGWVDFQFFADCGINGEGEEDIVNGRRNKRSKREV